MSVLNELKPSIRLLGADGTEACLAAEFQVRETAMETGSEMNLNYPCYPCNPW